MDDAPGTPWAPGHPRAPVAASSTVSVVTARHALRLLAATVTYLLGAIATSALVLLSASPVWAAARDDGDQSGPGLSAVQTVLIFVGIPVALFAVIALLATAPSLARRPRYQPGVSWWAEPVWFNGPAMDSTANATDTAGSGDLSDRSDPTHPGDPAQRALAGSATTNGGGTSARW